MSENTKYVDKAGKHRSGKIIQCLRCHKNFITRLDQPQKFCSKDCRYKHSSESRCVLVCCAWCGKSLSPIKLSQHNRCKSGLHFCSSRCHGLASRLDGGISEVMPAHFGNGNGKYTYRKLFSSTEIHCHICGYDKHPSVIVVHHVDGNRQHNDKSNLLPVCCNCHEEIHLGIASIPKPEKYVE